MIERYRWLLLAVGILAGLALLGMELSGQLPTPAELQPRDAPSEGG